MRGICISNTARCGGLISNPLIASSPFSKVFTLNPSDLSNKETDVKKVEIWTQDIRGIIYYIDDNNNVYNTKDIFENKINPQIIAKYEKNDKGEFTIIQ